MCDDIVAAALVSIAACLGFFLLGLTVGFLHSRPFYKKLYLEAMEAWREQDAKYRAFLRERIPNIELPKVSYEERKKSANPNKDKLH